MTEPRPSPRWPRPENPRPNPLVLKLAIGLMAATFGMALGDIYASSFPFHINAHLGSLYFDNQSVGAFGGFAIGGIAGYKGTELAMKAGQGKRR